ncbi:tape measure protein [Lapidilactobacillus luobeiensis]|uniref:tape measure protein n=1 Tax=Lapidilactobacillus luobeiensis TaxID=2950371 RepID=UPI0021C427D8|nr:tape measure protein [Lapidilactobacillus luobeiensis]
MVKKIQAEMSTKIALDLMGATQSIKGLTSAVKSSQSAWKSQEAMFKSTGESVKAAETRYDGLGKAIGNQEQKIELLKKRQSELQGNTKETAQAYLKYQEQIDKAKTQLASMQGQQERAKSAMEYQNSGLAKLQSSYRETSRVSQSYVERLQAEGKTAEANKARISGYKNSITNLTKQLQLQEKELSRVATESGQTSSAYAKQKVRVNETAASLAKARNNMDNLNDEMKKANPSIFTRMKTAITGMNKEGAKTHSLFKSVLSANLITNVIQSGWSKLTGAIGSAKDSAMAYATAQQTMNATWLTLTGNAKQGQKMVDMTNQMAVSAANSTDMVDSMNQKFFAINKNADKTKELTQSVLTLQDAFGQSDDAVMNFSTQFAQMLANGKVGAQDMMSFVNTFPVLRTNLLKTEQQITGNHKMSMKQMNDLMSAGKISSEVMSKVLQDTAKQYGAATENFGKTIPGMTRTIKSQMPVLMGEITKPLLNAQNPVMATISGWVTSSKTSGMFKTLGKTFSDGLNGTINAFMGDGKGAANSVVNSLNASIEKLNSGIDIMFTYLRDHASDIKRIGSDSWEIVKALGSGVWDVFKATLSTINQLLGNTSKSGKEARDPLKQIKDILDWMVEHKSGIRAFGSVLAGLWMTKKVVGFGSAIHSVYTNLKKMTGLDLSGLKDNLGSLTSGDSFKGIGQSIKSAGGLKGLSTAGKIGTGLAGAGIAVDAGVDIYTAITSKNKTEKFEKYGSGIGKAIGGGIGLFFGGPLGAAVGTKIGGLIGKWGGQGSKKFMDGWNKSTKKKPEDWLAGLGWDAHKMSTKIGRWWDSVRKMNVAEQKKQQNEQIKANREAQKAWNSFWSKINKGWGSFWSGVHDKASSGMSKVKSVTESGVNWVALKFKNGWSGIKTTTSSVFQGVHDAISSPMEKARSAVATAIAKIKGLFDFKISWPHIPLPHFSISGSANPIDWIKKHETPHVSVEWHANGGLLDRPTLLGITGKTMHIGGEAGPEMIMPLSVSKASRSWQLLGQAVNHINRQNQSQINVSGNDHDTELENQVSQLIGLVGNLVGNTTAILQALAGKGDEINVQQLIAKLLPGISTQQLRRQGLVERGLSIERSI